MYLATLCEPLVFFRKAYFQKSIEMRIHSAADYPTGSEWNNQRLDIDKQDSNCLYMLSLKWVMKYPWLIRTVFFDPEEQSSAFVVSYSEKKQQYILIKFEQATGHAIWKKALVNGGYGTPTVFRDYVFCLSTHDSLTAFDKKTGMVFIGAGEPPVNGLLCCYSLKKDTVSTPEIIQMFYTGNSIEGTQLELTIQTSHAWDSVVIDSSIISSVEKVTATNVGAHIFGFTIPLKSTNIESCYALPLDLIRNGKIMTQMITIELQRTIPLPTKVLLHEYNTTVSAETPFTSGAALIQMIEQHYGHTMNQKDIRQIIDYLKEQSKWEDADFQTWRLIMKRALNSPAKNLAEFIRNECKNQGAAP